LSGVPAAPVLAAGLAGTAILLAAPVSAALARAQWPRRAPRAALVLWQAVCLSAGLCLVGAGVVLAFQPLGADLLRASRTWFTDLSAGHPLERMSGHGIVAGTTSTLIALILFGVLVRSAILTARRRRTHRLVLDLLTGDPPAGQTGRPGEPVGSKRVARVATDRGVEDLLVDVRILDHPAPVAYTLPGWHSRIVLSAGMLHLLDRAELIAVVDHERAHIRSRHDLLVLPFQAWATAVGWLPGVRAAGQSVAELTEMLADDGATRRSSPAVLARALATVALSGVGESGLVGSQTPAVAGRAVSARVERLLRPIPLARWALSCIYVAAVLLLALPVVPLVIGWS